MWKNSKNYFQENKTRPYSHTLKPPRFLVCDDLRKIFCKINPIKAKKKIETMYYVPDGTDSFITGAIHPVLQQVQMAGHIGIMMTALI